MSLINSNIPLVNYGTIRPQTATPPESPFNLVDSFDDQQPAGFQVRNALIVVAHNMKGYVGNEHRMALLAQIERMPGSFFRRTPKNKLKEALAEFAPEKLNQKLLALFQKTPNPVENTDWQQVIELIKLGANPNLRVSQDGHTIGHRAVQNNRLDVLTHWVHAPGVNLNAQGPGGRTPLRFAARMNVELARCLIERGADLDSTDVNGNTPLMSAAFNSEAKQKSPLPDIVELLIQSGAQLTLSNHAGAFAWTHSDTSCRDLMRRYLERSPQRTALNLSPDPAHLKLREERPLTAIPIDFKNVIKRHAKRFGIYDGLKTIIDNVSSKNPVVCALPKSPAGKLKYYEDLQRHLEHIASALNNPDIPDSTKRTALNMLNEGGIWCATRQLQETVQANWLLNPPPAGVTEADPLEHYIEDSLYQLRSQLFHGLLPNLGVHTYNTAMAALGTELGLAKPGAFYEGDTFANPQLVSTMRSKFYHAYSSSAIIATIQRDVKNGKIPFGVLSCLVAKYQPQTSSDEEPDQFHQRMLQEDGTFTWSAVPHVLTGMGILKPLYDQLIGISTAYLQDIMPKSREAYLAALQSGDFAKKNSRRLSLEQAERLLEATTDPEEPVAVLYRLPL